MALMTTHPWKHPKTKIFYLRRRVPTDLVAALDGKTMEYFTLRTRDPEDAKRLHASAVVKLEAKYAGLRAGPRPLSEREAHELAAGLHDSVLAAYRDCPSQQAFWSTDLGADLWSAPEKPRGSVVERAGKMLRGDFEDARREEARKACEAEKRRMRGWCAEQADRLIKDHGLVTDDTSRWELTRAVGAAMQRVSLTLERMGRGETVGLPPPMPQEPPTPPANPAKPDAPVLFTTLFEAYAAERRLRPKTRYEWARAFDKLAASVGHGDAVRLTTDDVIKWKDGMVAEGLAAKTIRDGYLAGVRAVLRWAAQNRRITGNPADGVTIAVRKKVGQGRRGFKDAEATLVLSAAARERDPVKRWVPLVCAYSGARLSEVCQLRAEDIGDVDGIATMRFDAEAGSLKNVGSERTVPLHSALIAAGFLDYVRGRKAGPLFPDLPPDKFGKRGGNGTKVLGRWVRSLGLTDTRLAPNHSWRHRFKTLARNHGLAGDLTDAITGHAHRSVGDGYGEYEISAMRRELEKIPAAPSIGEGPSEPS